MGRFKGVEIAKWHTDLDQSGGKMSRPGLDAALRQHPRKNGGLAVAASTASRVPASQTR